MKFNFLGGNISKLRGHFFLLFLRGRRADFKAGAILMLRLRTANLPWGATINEQT